MSEFISIAEAGPDAPVSDAIFWEEWLGDDVDTLTLLEEAELPMEELLKHLPGRHDQQRHAPHRATAPTGSLPDDYEDTEAAKRYLKGVMQLERPGAERTLDVTIPNPERVKYKKKVMQDLAADTGLSEERVKELVDSWASTSNDEDPKALGLQKAAEDVFGARLTGWQEDKVADAEAGKRYSRHYYDEAREDGAKLLTAMHKRTQEEFAGLDKVTLYRGVQGDQVRNMRTGEKELVAFNALESWSLDYGVASDFANMEMTNGVVMRTTVPVERIVSTPKTGFGCLNEFEMLVHGVGADDLADEVEIVWSSEDPF